MKLNIVDNLDIAPDDGVNYMVELSVGSFRIASGASSGTLSLSASGWKKEGDAARAAYSCHYALYTRSGSSYSRKAYSSSKSTSWASGSQTIASTVDEVIVVISDSVMSAAAFASALPTSILAKTSVAVSKDGDQGLHGGNTATVFLYKRSSSAVSSVGISVKLYYKFSTPKKIYSNAACTTEATSANLNQWSMTIPDGTGDIYVTSAIAFSTSESDEIATSEWVTPVPLAKNGSSGYGIVAFLTRNNFTEANWNTYGTIGHDEGWTYQVVNADGTNNGVQTSTIRNGCRIGDFFSISGMATDTGNTHRLIYVSTNASGNLAGTCVAHEVTKAAHGATGKMCYIVGEYLDTIEYTSNSKATVAVEIVSGAESELWFLTASTNVVNGVHIGPKDSGQQVWEQGLNTYNLVRTKYLFADFAQLGSGIVSGDWLFSMSGVIYINDVPQDYGPSSTYANKPAYLRFDPDYPDSDSGYQNFIPNYAVDLKTGKSYQQDAVLRGTVYASSGVIGGFVIGSTSLGSNGYTGNETGYTYITRNGLIKAYKSTSATGNALDITGNISLVANSGQNIVLTTGGTGNIQINLSGNANSKLILGSPNMWKRTASTVGEVYIDSNNFLKVKVS